ncbi:hypothetical protein T4A_5151 [Trichinella pseudospiralis]|uniref:Uncharacterized protein n=1 Tax=Trichinella pseudospiralis TaxID=6337 RepID=A0A0V1AMN2_TRIPS|nr:hypothetical protein T4A_5151 [Trichinella pseudospiralis]
MNYKRPLYNAILNSENILPRYPLPFYHMIRTF